MRPFARAGDGRRTRMVQITVGLALLASAFGPRPGSAAALGAQSPIAGQLAGNPEDTSANVHLGLGAVDGIADCCSSLTTTNPPVGQVWDWNNGDPSSYPSIYKGQYFPVDRQPDSQYYPAAKPVSWFVSNHPDWLEFTCAAAHLSEAQAVAAGDVAYEFGDTSAIPLDTANEAVVQWLEETFWGPAAATGDYGHLDFDNFQMNNGGSWSGQR
ncbi:MAG TPA: hypothetical protein VKV02_00305, partial [Acidobacteriaceae bacterium]|nr:hypothetical protein [Acidobacteriaceae bacterium]